jgi:hypothetical protein
MTIHVTVVYNCVIIVIIVIKAIIMCIIIVISGVSYWKYSTKGAIDGQSDQ